jgi:hypothetical protein
MSDARPGLELLEFVAARLGPLRDEVVFLGGAAIALLITDPAAPELRHTTDVDVVLETATLSDYYNFANRLRNLGFREDTEEGAPLCRWRIDHVAVDVMPTDSTVLGFSNRWYSDGFANSLTHQLSDRTKIRLMRAPHFLATKIEAFYGRGAEDFFASRDVEDIVAVIDGRPEIIDEIRESGAELRAFLAKELATFMDSADFRDALSGHVEPDSASQERVPVVAERIKAIIVAGN